MRQTSTIQMKFDAFLNTAAAMLLLALTSTVRGTDPLNPADPQTKMGEQQKSPLTWDRLAQEWK